jgi:hypothetical protein
MTYEELLEREARSCKAYVRAQTKLMEGLQKWVEEGPSEHLNDRLKHYYLVYKDCKANVDRADEAIERWLENLPEPKE